MKTLIPRRPGSPLIVAGVLALLFTACRHDVRQAPRSIVLITIDTLRADHVTPALMPALSALGQEGVVFEQAITVAPLTLPAHASLLTGRFPPGHGIRDNELFALPADVPTYAEQLKARGYSTGAFVSAVVLDHRYGLNHGFDIYDDEIAGPERAAAETIARAQGWMDRASRPFFVWIHLFEPHAPYRTGSYAGEVTAADTALAAFFNHLRDAGMWNDIVVSVTADHGESLGEHREQTHGFFLYDSTLRIPWILKGPGLQPGRVGALVRIVDEMPTILDAADVQIQRSDDKRTDGVDVAPLIRGGTLRLEAYSETFLPRDQFGWSPLTAIRTDRLKYIAAPQPELYDLVADASESANVVSDRPPDAGRLKQALAAMSTYRAAAAARATMDPALTEKLMSLGYIGHATTVAASPTHLADPKSKVEVYNLTMSALELSEKGDVTGGLAVVKKAEALDPNVAQIEFLKGTLLGRIGRYDEAAVALQRTVALDPDYTAARFKLALALLRTGRPDAATDALQEVVRQQPDDFRAWHNLAAIAYSRGDLDAAETLDRKSIAISPNYSEAWNTLGAIALVRHQTSAAVDALTKATQFGPQNAQAFDNLALAYRSAGAAGRADEAARHACELDRRFCRSAR